MKPNAGTRILTSTDKRLSIEIVDPLNPPERPFLIPTRFSTMAFPLQVECDGHSYAYCPERVGHERSFPGGVPMEFDLCERTLPPGFAEAPQGGEFMKIGVGLLRRTTDKYDFMNPYPYAAKPANSVEWSADCALFRQIIGDNSSGYSGRLEVEVSLKGNQLWLHCLLQNTGRHPFTTEQYVHNFFAFNGQPLSSDYVLDFPYTSIITDPQGNPGTLRSPFSIQGNSISFIPDIPKEFDSMKLWTVAPKEYTKPHSFILRHRGNGRSVTVTASVPAANTAIWVSRDQVSPEVNLLFTLKPGEQVKFTRSYTFN